MTQHPIHDNPLDPYRAAVEKHGPSFDVTLWASRKSQRLRFKVIAQSVYLSGKRILDAGCSRGDLAAFLIKHRVAFEKYIGVDGLPGVIDFARGRGLERCAFHTGDLLEDAALWKIGDPQVVVISGTLNTMNDGQVERVLNHAWEAASQTLVFNFLSDRHGPKAPEQHWPARRLSTMKLVDWALSKTYDVTLKQDYFRQGHDATIVMKKAE